MKKITLFLSLTMGLLSFSQNLVTNGNFQTGVSSPWYGNAASVADLGGSNFVNQANITSVGPPYVVNLSQDVLLQDTRTYQLTFDAFTDATTGIRTMVVGLGQNNAPYAALTSTPTLSSTSQTFSYQYTINYGDAVADRVIFDMGADTGFVFIDNVSVVEVVNTCANGMMDGTETGIDCGGTCAACVFPPTVAATTPPARLAAEVVSIYSDAYASVSPITYDAGWCGANAVQTLTIGADNTFAFKDKPCQGMTFPSAIQNLTGFTRLHVDLFVASGTDLVGKVFNLKAVPTSGAESQFNIDLNALSPAPVPGTWYSYDVPITFAGPTSSIHEFGVTSNLNNIVWYDNLYFHKNTVLASSSFEASKVKMYPNPANNIVTIDAIDTVESVSIVNLLGQTVMNKDINASSFTLDISDLNAGHYFINLNSNNTKVVKKIIKN